MDVMEIRSPHSRYSMTPSRIINTTLSCNGHTPDVSIRDKTRLLQLADRIQTRKGASHQQSPQTPVANCTLRTPSSSYGRVVSPLTPSNGLPTEIVYSSNNSMPGRRFSTPNVSCVVGNTNSNGLVSTKVHPNSYTMSHGRVSLVVPPPSTIMTPLSGPGHSHSKNPKFYASFSTKSASKRVSKGFLKNDPAKTNIEHLVKNKTRDGGGSVSSNSSGTSQSPSPTSDVTASNGGMNFISPLKALHASFHDRTKLSSAFSPRGKLFSQREKAGNPRLIMPLQSCRISNFSDSNGIDNSTFENRCERLNVTNAMWNGEMNEHVNGGNSNPRVISVTPDILGGLGYPEPPPYPSKVPAYEENRDPPPRLPEKKIRAPVPRRVASLTPLSAPPAIPKRRESIDTSGSFDDKGRLVGKSLPNNSVMNGMAFVTVKMETEPNSTQFFSQRPLLSVRQDGQTGLNIQPRGNFNHNGDCYRTDSGNNYSNSSTNDCNLWVDHANTVTDGSHNNELLAVKFGETPTTRRQKVSKSHERRKQAQMSSDAVQIIPEIDDGQFERKRSRSLPKSFMSVRDGIRNAIPSLWNNRDGDELLFQRLDDRKSSCPDPPVTQPYPYESVKMRWPKSSSGSTTLQHQQHPQQSTSNNSTTTTSVRPKSLDYSQRKAWIRLYRDLEVSSVAGEVEEESPSVCISSKSPRATSTSVTHLHYVDSGLEDKTVDGGETEMPIAKRHPEAFGMTPSLFQRFSKTFSLRFGAGSSTNVSKAGQGSSSNNRKKDKRPIGSSPDLYNRTDSEQRSETQGKLRKSNGKSGREEKCQSGDSGIGMMDEPTKRVSRLRRIQSEFLDPTTIQMSSPPPRPAVIATSSPSMKKLSLVEIPDHVWEQSHNHHHHSSRGTYEEKVDDDADDGFDSPGDDEANDRVSSSIVNPPPGYFHSLPLKMVRKNKVMRNIDVSTLRTEDNNIRSKVVKEIVYTEQNYVKTLNDIVQGFLNPCRERRDLFSSQTVRHIFSNIEEILRLHARFLEVLKSRLDVNALSRSCVGKIFIAWADAFELYSEYCCNNPISMATVRNLCQRGEYTEFFEACRRLQVMDKLPLHGFLLRPIQRICQYHLQLNELLKQTEKTHEDYESVVEALETMKSVAMKINDSQREFDALQDLIRLQNSIDNWEGPNLIDRNAAVLHKGELHRMTQGRRHKEVYVILLNKELIFCKKDFIRKNGLIYDGRVDLDFQLWLNIDSNEEDECFGMVHNSWRIYSREKNAWILFTASSPSEKRKWIAALEKSAETHNVDTKMREMAKLTMILSNAADQGVQLNGAGSSVYNPMGNSSNTLPKRKSKDKIKQNGITHSPSVVTDAMLMEVGKLRRSAYSNPNGKEKDRASKFYV